MMVGMLVLPRGTVGMIEASTTRRPSKPRTPARRVGHRVAVVGVGAHPAGADRMERAGDVLRGCARPAPSSSCTSVCRSTWRSASVENTGPASGGTRSISLAITALWILFLALMPVEPAQPVVELHRERHAAHRAHLLVRQHLDRAAEALHEALEVELVAAEVELDQRLGRRSADFSATRPRAIGLSSVGARLATCKPSGLHDVLHCTLMYMSVRGAPGRPEE